MINLLLLLTRCDPYFAYVQMEKYVLGCRNTFKKIIYKYIKDNIKIIYKVVYVHCFKKSLKHLEAKKVP